MILQRNISTQLIKYLFRLIMIKKLPVIDFDRVDLIIIDKCLNSIPDLLDNGQGSQVKLARHCFQICILRIHLKFEHGIPEIL